MILPKLSSGSSRLTIATNTLSQLTGRVVSSVAIFIASLLIARTFGPDGYGDFIKITSFIALFFLLGDFGLNAVYLQKTQDRESHQDLWATLIGVRVLGSIILVFLSLAVLAFLPQGTTQGYTNSVRLGIILFSPAILLQSLITTANAVFQQKLRYDLSMIAAIAGSFVTVGLVWLIVLAASPLVGPTLSVVAFLLGTLVTLGVSIFFVRRFLPLRISLDPTLAKGLIAASVPLGLTLLFNQIYFRADSFILTLTRSTSDVGIYGFAYKVFEVALVVPTFFMNSLYPMMLARTIETDDQSFKRLINKSIIFLSLSSVVIVGVLWIFAPLLGEIRSEFMQSVSALRILSLSLPFFFLSSLSMWTIISRKRQALLVPIYGASMILNVIFNAWLIPMYGYIAAAWITVVSEGLVLLATSIVAVRLVYSSKKS